MSGPHSIHGNGRPAWVGANIPRSPVRTSSNPEVIVMISTPNGSAIVITNSQPQRTHQVGTRVLTP